MAKAYTTLASACAAGDQKINVTSATGAAIGQIWQVDGEFMVQIAAATGTSIPVSRRGYNGSAAGVAHNILAPVMNCTVSELPGTSPGQLINPSYVELPQVSYGASGAIALPAYSTLVFLDKASAASMTLADPTSVPDGTRLVIYSTTAAAHTVTYTAGFYGDTTSSDVATFTAKAGASMTIMASKGTWGVLALANVTIA